jgi:hypothetical protein
VTRCEKESPQVISLLNFDKDLVWISKLPIPEDGCCCTLCQEKSASSTCSSKSMLITNSSIQIKFKLVNYGSWKTMWLGNLRSFCSSVG